MAHDNCDPKDKWPLRNDCDLRNLRPKRGGVAAIFRAANSGVRTLFRRGLPLPVNLRDHNVGFQTLFRTGVIAPFVARPEYRGGLEGLRPKRGEVATIFRTADGGVQALFRYGLPVPVVLRSYSDGFQTLFRADTLAPSTIRPEFHCTPRPEYVLTPLYNENRDFVYNESGVLVFCEIRII